MSENQNLYTTSSTSGKTIDLTSESPEERAQEQVGASSAVEGGHDPMDAPVRKLTVNLIRTYKYINHVYYENKQKRQQAKATEIEPPKRVYDDENSDYIIRPGELLKDRYMVRHRIGKGSFGQVVMSFDPTNKCDVAIKIIKSKRVFFQQAQVELELLKELKDKDPDDKYGVVRILDDFVHQGHQCLVFELLSFNLYELLKQTHFHGVSLNLVRKFARQILKSLHFLRRKDINMIHCDLKPENILLRHHKRSAIKVVDFGSSCKSDKQFYTYIQSRFYRSPEVILGCSYGVAIDMWSLACILVEMHTGEPLFCGTDEREQIIRFVAICGMPPDSVLLSSSKFHEYFKKRIGNDLQNSLQNKVYGKSQYKLKDRGDSPSEMEVSVHQKSLHHILGLEDGSPPYSTRMKEPGHSREMYGQFIDLINTMLTYKQDARISPESALQHPFIIFDPNSNASALKSTVPQPRPPMAKRPGSAPAAAFNQPTRRSSRVKTKN